MTILQRAAANPAPVKSVPPTVHEVLRSPGQPLDAGTRAFMEPRFGYDLSHVRVHHDARAVESAHAVNALAYTVGRDIVFGARQYAPGTRHGQRLLAHELTHVVQQLSLRPRQGMARLQRQTPATATSTQPRAIRPRGPNPTAAMTPLCVALAHPSAVCLNNPQACAQRWITDVMNSLTPRAPASNATNFQAILDNTRQELRDEVNAIDTWFNGLSPADKSRQRRDYVDWLKSVCERKQREIGIEFRFNVVFQTVPGQPPWAYYASDWDAIEAALEAIPDEHLWDRVGGPQVTTFRREAIGPAAVTGQVVGGETDPTTGLIKVYSAGIGQAPYTRSQGLNLPATFQTLRHEVGHLVETLVPTEQVRRFFNDIVGWREYSWAWVSVYPSPYPNWQAERELLCRDAGLTNPNGQCNQSRLTQLLSRLGVGTTVQEGNRTYTRGQSFAVSWLTGNVPMDRAFEYARTSKSDYFAELYALATSVPEFLHEKLPPDQITWLKEQVFHTQEHYQNLIAPFDSQLASAGSESTALQFRTLQQLARKQFTRQQLERVAQQLQQVLQRLGVEHAGQELV